MRKIKKYLKKYLKKDIYIYIYLEERQKTFDNLLFDSIL